MRIKATGEIPFLNEFLSKQELIPFELVEIPMHDISPLPLDEVIEGVVDITTPYDFSFLPEIKAIADANNVSSLYAGKDTLSFFVTKSNPLAEAEHLERQDLENTTIVIPNAKWYDYMTLQANAFFGEGLNLKSKTLPEANLLSAALRRFGKRHGTTYHFALFEQGSLHTQIGAKRCARLPRATAHNNEVCFLVPDQIRRLVFGRRASCQLGHSHGSASQSRPFQKKRDA